MTSVTDKDDQNKQFIFAKQPTIYIIHENDKWMEPLREAFQSLGISFVEWHLGLGGAFDFSTPPPEGVFYSRMSASSHTRGHRFAAEHTHAVLEWLELYGRKVVNGSRALSLEISKIRQYRALEKLGIKTPHTVVISGNIQDGKERYGDAIVTAAEKSFKNCSYLTKHNRSGRGLGVRLFKESQYLKNYVESVQYEVPVDGITLLQEYIQSPDNSVVRCEFIGGKFMYAVRINTSEGFENCPADYCSVIQNFKTKFEIIPNFDHPIIAQYEQFLQENQIGIAGIEFVVDMTGNLYTFDVNTNTNYNLAAEKTFYGTMTGMMEIAKYLNKELQEITGTSIPEPELTTSDFQSVEYHRTDDYTTFPQRVLYSIGSILSGLAALPFLQTKVVAG